MLKKIYIEGRKRFEKGIFKIIRLVDGINEFHMENPPYLIISFMNYKMDVAYRDNISKGDKGGTKKVRFSLYMRKTYENYKQKKRP